MKKILILCLIATLFLVSYSYAAPSIWSDSISKEFEIVYDTPVCYRDTWVWKWWEAGELKETSSLTSCYRADGTPNICCPEGHICEFDDPTDENYMKCVPVSYVINYCEDHTISLHGSESVADAECNSTPTKIAANSIGRLQDYPAGVCSDDYREINKSNPLCSRDVDCHCYWNAEEDKCQPGLKKWLEICDVPGNPHDHIVPDQTDGTCIYNNTDIQGDCSKDSDFITITWQRIWQPVTTGATAPAECTGTRSRSIGCPSKLTFFTLLSFFAVAVVIIVIYAFKSSRKKRGN